MAFAKKDVNYWKDITPLVVPFHHPVFSLNHVQVEKAKHDECGFSKSNRQITTQPYSIISPECKRGKVTHPQNYITPLDKSGKRTQAQKYVKHCYVRLKRLETEKKDTQRLSKENGITSNKVGAETDRNSKRSKRILKVNSSVIKAVDIENKNSPPFPKQTTFISNKGESELVLEARIPKEICSKNVLKNDAKLKMSPRVSVRRVEDVTPIPKQTTSILNKGESEIVFKTLFPREICIKNVLKNDAKLKMCPYVSVRRVEEAAHFPKQTTSILDKGESELVFKGIPKGICSENVLRNDVKSNMCPRVSVWRVEDSVRFLSCVNLQPKWTDTCIFQPKVRIEKLGKLRKQQ